MGKELAKELYGDKAEAPGRGEIVGGADAQLVEQIAGLIRKKGGKDQIQNLIAATRAAARYEGAVDADQRGTKRLVEAQQVLADKVVCGFIGEVEFAQRVYAGLPPDMVWSVSSYTLLRIVDALNVAGYSARGRKG